MAEPGTIDARFWVVADKGGADVVGLEVWAKTVDTARQRSRKHDMRSKPIAANDTTLRSHSSPSVLAKESVNVRAHDLV